MAEQFDQELISDEKYDVFLCTRDLPDQLTAETAAVRQLCAALTGSGYRVFFPSALRGSLTDEERAQKMVNVLRTAPVMIAAAVGDEGALDPVAQKLWNAFCQRAAEDPSVRFLPCCRDLSPETLAAMGWAGTALDMGELEFLVKLKEKLTSALPRQEEAPEEEPPEAQPVPEEVSAPEDEPTPKPETQPAPEEPKGRPRWLRWALLAAAAVVVVVLILLLKKH